MASLGLAELVVIAVVLVGIVLLALLRSRR
jgi:hypothetical protein